MLPMMMRKKSSVGVVFLMVCTVEGGMVGSVKLDCN